MEANSAAEDADFSLLAHELFEQFARLGHSVRPDTRNFTRGEAGVIRTLHLADEAGEHALTPTQIAERSYLSSARTANVLRSLENKGWIRREHDTADRRRVTVTLTEAGEEERTRRRAQMDAEAGEFLRQLGARDASEAIRILKRCNEILNTRIERSEAE